MSRAKSIFRTVIQLLAVATKSFIFILKIIFKLIRLWLKIIPFVFNEFSQWVVKRLRFSITFKITTVYAVIFALTLLLLNTVICAAFIAYLGINAKDNLGKDFQIVSSFLRGSTELPTKDIKNLAKPERVDITIFSERRKVLYTTENNASPVFYRNHYRNIINLNNNYYLVINSPPSYYNLDHGLALVLNDQVTWQGQKIYIQINNYLAQETISIGLLAAVLFTITIIALIVIILIGSRASKNMLIPVEKMTRTVQKITINALDTRLDVGGAHDELKELAETFNSMLDRIQLSYEQQNQFVSDASHELRTPIAVIQGYTNLLDRWGKNDQSILEESITSIKTEAENMKDLVEKLLFLARGDKGTIKIEKEPFSLDELVNEIVKETNLIDKTHEITAHIEKITVHADRKLLKEALRIFVDNSLKYTPEGGKIIIDCHSQKSQAVISVKDTGVGIPEKDLPYIFNRFYRADKSRTKQTGGTGLGLAIAKWIIVQHQGNIHVESKINEGTKIIISLPDISIK